MTRTYQFYKTITDIPKEWEELAKKNIFFSLDYLIAMSRSSPKNMDWIYGMAYDNHELIGIFIFQVLRVRFKESFRYKKRNLISKIKELTNSFINFRILILGNLTLSGQNAWIFSDLIKLSEQSILLGNMMAHIEKTYEQKLNLLVVKDEEKKDEKMGSDLVKHKWTQFEVQPMMEMNLESYHSDFDNYLNALSTKYRTRYKRAIKKFEGIEKKELSLEDIEKEKTTIYNLYLNVSNNAGFNTFILPENHFYQMKMELKDKFKLFGYYEDKKLVGFYSFILNHSVVDTYFLGYEPEIQREKQLYLNALYDMLKFSISNHYSMINYGRTALEIKSTVGAEPVELVGWIKSPHFIINPFMRRLFNYFNPKLIWEKRTPFK